MKKQKNNRLSLQKLSITKLNTISSIKGGGTSAAYGTGCTSQGSCMGFGDSIGDGSTDLVLDRDAKQ